MDVAARETQTEKQQSLISQPEEGCSLEGENRFSVDMITLPCGKYEELCTFKTVHNYVCGEICHDLDPKNSIHLLAANTLKLVFYASTE